MIFFLVGVVTKIFMEKEANTGGYLKNKENLIQGVWEYLGW